MTTISLLAIIVASIVSFGISSLWYSPFLFGRQWLEAVRISNSDLEDFERTGVIGSYIVQFIITVIMFAVLAFIVSFSSARGGTDGAFWGFLLWIGFVIPLSISALLWKKESFSLIIIDALNMLLSLVVGGAIIGAWR